MIILKRLSLANGDCFIATKYDLLCTLIVVRFAKAGQLKGKITLC